MSRLVGPAKAKEIIWSGRQIRADEALALGIVDRVVPMPTWLPPRSSGRCELAAGAVVAMGTVKRSSTTVVELPLAGALDLEQDVHSSMCARPRTRPGRVQSFLDHGPGKAKFSGR